MAGLKKKKNEPSTSPNTILVIFLVLFVLLSIGFGVWGYLGMANVAEAKNDKDKAVKDAAAKNTTAKYYSMLYSDLRLALGDKLDEQDEGRWKVDREGFMKDDFGEYKNESNKEAYKKLMLKLAADYGVDDAGHYKKPLMVELQIEQAKAKDLEAKNNASMVAHDKTKDLLKELQTKQDQFHQDALARIQKNNKQAMDLAQGNRAAYAAAVAANRDLQKQIEDKDKKTDEVKDDYEKRLKIKDFAIRDLQKAIATGEFGAGGGVPLGTRPGGESFPLILDINPGKPLWDSPVGKIVRVDLEVRQVYINLGSAHGIKPETTFNVFGANAAGRAEKQLKGSIEVIKVLDTTTSLARITSLFDAEGNEILLHLESRTKFQRETEIPIKEGDLLFNLFWGTRVAVAGYVNLTGEPSNNPAEQIRQMDDFLHLLRRNGMQVDAYVDMRDGQIRGNLSSKTRYLIRGEDFRTPLDKPAAAAPSKEADDKDKDKEPGKEKEAGAAEDRIESINKSSVTLRKEAVDRGMLLISAENFAHMTGYRRARSANAVEASGFRPMLPFAGEAGRVIRAPDRPAAPAPEEKKDAAEDKK